jgi:hypothetical protein
MDGSFAPCVSFTENTSKLSPPKSAAKYLSQFFSANLKQHQRLIERDCSRSRR